MTKKVLAPTKWDEYHCRAMDIILRADISLGLCTIKDLKRHYIERIEVEDYEGAKAINKLIRELEQDERKKINTLVRGRDGYK